MAGENIWTAFFAPKVLTASNTTKEDIRAAAEIFLKLLSSMIYTMTIAGAVIFALYFIINRILVRRIKKMTPAEVLKNRE